MEIANRVSDHRELSRQVRNATVVPEFMQNMANIVEHHFKYKNLLLHVSSILISSAFLIDQ